MDTLKSVKAKYVSTLDTLIAEYKKTKSRLEEEAPGVSDERLREIERSIEKLERERSSIEPLEVGTLEPLDTLSLDDIPPLGSLDSDNDILEGGADLDDLISSD